MTADLPASDMSASRAACCFLCDAFVLVAVPICCMIDSSERSGSPRSAASATSIFARCFVSGDVVGLVAVPMCPAILGFEGSGDCDSNDLARGALDERAAAGAGSDDMVLSCTKEPANVIAWRTAAWGGKKGREKRTLTKTQDFVTTDTTGRDEGIERGAGGLLVACRGPPSDARGRRLTRIRARLGCGVVSVCPRLMS